MSTKQTTTTQPKQPNFQKIETITTGYFPYIVGKFTEPDVYVLGVMDLNDPASWSGGESAINYYFLITPEEYTWLNEDREKLDELAKNIQTNLPKSRFFSAICNKKIDPEQLKAATQAALKEDKLENDEAFEEWKKTVKFNRVVRMPATPVNLARHKLAVFQKNFNVRTATQEEKDEEEKLERELGWLLLKADELYVSFDTSYNARWPYLEIARGDAHIFTTKEFADAATKYYADGKLFFSEIHKMEKDGVKAFFRSCEDLGILRFRVDDGIEPVEVWRRNILPDRSMGHLEKRNQGIRNVSLRTMQGASLLAKHGNEMSEKWKKGITSWFMTWQRNMFQDVANTLLYVPVGLPEEVAMKMVGSPIYTERSMAKMKEILQRDKQPESAMNHPNFKGRVFTINGEKVQLPIRLMRNNETQKTWLLAFTSYSLADSFVKQSKQNDTVVTLSFDELVEQVGENAGIAVDINGIGLQLGEKEINQMMTIRTQPKVIFRPEPEKAPETAESKESQNASAAQQETNEIAAEAVPAEDAPAVESTIPAEEYPQVEVVDDEEDTEDEADADAAAEVTVEVTEAPAENADAEEKDDEEKKGGFLSKFFKK